MIWLSTFGVPLLVYLVFAVPALYYLRKHDMDETARAVWALAIVAVSVMGAVDFATMRRGDHSH